MNVITLKVAGASVAFVLVALQALTMYQLFGRGRPFPASPRTLMTWHRVEGFVLLCLFTLIGYQCVTRLKVDWSQPRVALHAVSATVVFAALSAKVVLVRVFRHKGPLVPALGIALAAAALTTVATSVPWYLYSRWNGVLPY